jgi:protein-tyrosine phosphatase
MIKVLFVCLGNICRSPSAEGIMKKFVKEKGLSNMIEIDSAGIGGWHIGEPADPMMRKAALKRGLKLDSKARQLEVEDLLKFDYIAAMDKDNLENILAYGNMIKDGYKAKVLLITDLLKNNSYKDGVPDPYGLGQNRFELVLNILEEACRKLLEIIIKENNLKPKAY